MGNFPKDKARGNKGENLVIQLLEDATIECGRLDGRKSDIWFKHDKKEYTCEIKYDYFAILTGNIAIEYYNPKKDAPSGIGSTTCDFWIHIINIDKIPHVYIIKVDELKKLIKTLTPFKTVENKGDNNANLHLFKKDKILPHFKLLLKDTIKQEINDLCSK